MRTALDENELRRMNIGNPRCGAVRGSPSYPCAEDTGIEP